MATKTYEDVWASADDAYKARFGGDKTKAIKAMSDWNVKQSASKEVKEIAPEETQMGNLGAQFDTRENQAMQQTVNNATSPGGGQIKNTGTGNTFAAALTPDGSGYIPLDSDYASAASRKGMTPQFSPGHDRTTPYTQDDVFVDSSTDEGIENRFSDPNFTGGRTKRQTAKAIKSIARDKARQTRKNQTPAERKSARIHERSEKSWEKTKKKLDL